MQETRGGKEPVRSGTWREVSLLLAPRGREAGGKTGRGVQLGLDHLLPWLVTLWEAPGSPGRGCRVILMTELCFRRIRSGRAE